MAVGECSQFWTNGRLPLPNRVTSELPQVAWPRWSGGPPLRLTTRPGVYLLAKPCSIHTLLDDLAIVYAKLLPSGASV